MSINKKKVSGAKVSKTAIAFYVLSPFLLCYANCLKKSFHRNKKMLIYQIKMR